MENKDFYSINEFAELLGVHHNTIRRSIKNGRLSAFRVGSGKKAMYRIAHSELGRISLFDLKDLIRTIIEKRINGERTPFDEAT